MEMTLEQANGIVEQVQTAHRLATAFYQRLLPRLADTAEKLDLEFWYWKPAHTQRPGNSATPPGKNWAWDYLPLFASRHVYRRIAAESARAGDVIAILDVHVDDQFRPENLKRAGVSGQPDPIKMERGRGTLTFHVYVCLQDDERSTATLWEKTKPPQQESSWRSDGAFRTTTVTVPLARFLAEPDAVTLELRFFLAPAPTD